MGSQFGSENGRNTAEQPVRHGVDQAVPLGAERAPTQTMEAALSWSLPLQPREYGHGDPLGPTDTGPRNYKRPDNLILDDVAKVLAWDPVIHAFELDVECEEGRVRVTGRQPLHAARQRLEVLIASVFGVREVSVQDVAVDKGITPPPDKGNKQDSTDSVADLDKNTMK